ncbi:hydrogen gas-evolving membrane-bound hydrogenase subunit E [Deinococcus radiophilus]|uniref:hydrogen gas-evolving membrane-bound hydrogenase subunit E n=1 Tax=Deinococcus radiophilus TaxID=32062 RepID=UPI003615944C
MAGHHRHRRHPADPGLALPSQLRFSLIAAGLIVAFVLLRAPQPFALDFDFSLSLLLIVTLLIAGAVGVLLARNRLTAVLLMGLTGFGTAAAFLAFRAPDLALTQMVIETVTVILFLLAFRYLPGVRDLPRTRAQYVTDLTIAAAAGLGTMVFVLASQPSLADKISPYHLAYSYKGGGGNNVVNVTLVDFRGFDTLGEIIVVGMVSLAVLALVRVGKRGQTGSNSQQAEAADPTSNMALIPTRQERERIRQLLIEQGTLSSPEPQTPPRQRGFSRIRQNLSGNGGPE